MEGVEVSGAEQMIEEIVETEEAKSERNKWIDCRGWDGQMTIDRNEGKYMVKNGMQWGLARLGNTLDS